MENMPQGDPMQMMSALMSQMGGMGQMNAAGGMRGMGSMGSNPKVSDDITASLNIDLKDVYNGTTKTVSVDRKILCDKCYEKESPKSDEKESPKSDEKESPKSDEKETCNTCKGNKYNIEKTDVIVVVKKGVYDNIVVKYEGHQLAIDKTGDLIVNININEHDIYERDENDLIMKKDISLNDALCGFTFKINDINDNELIVKTDKIVDLEPLGLVGKGLPDYETPEEYGNIVILFDIVFPKELSPEVKLELRKLLPDSESLDETGEQVITLEEVDYDSETESETESEEDEPRRDAPPGCATQ